KNLLHRFLLHRFLGRGHLIREGGREEVGSERPRAKGNVVRHGGSSVQKCQSAHGRKSVKGASVRQKGDRSWERTHHQCLLNGNASPKTSLLWHFLINEAAR